MFCKTILYLEHIVKSIIDPDETYQGGGGGALEHELVRAHFS